MYEEFRRKTGYIHFGKFYIFAIEAAEILKITRTCVILLIITSNIYIYM